MAQTTFYNIEKTNGNSAFTIQPGTVDGAPNITGAVQRNTDLTLYGSGASQWGKEFNENLYRLLENFAIDAKTPVTVPPVPQDENDLGVAGKGVNNPIIGQLWFNKTDDTIYVWTGTIWRTATSGTSIGDITGLQTALTNLDNDIQTRVLRAGDTMAGILNMGAHRLENVANPNSDDDGMPRLYADNRYILEGGDTATGIITFGAGLAIPAGQEIVLQSGQTDPGAIYKYEPGVDESHTRIRLSDNDNSPLDLLDIGSETTGVWNSATTIDTQGNIRTTGSIFIDSPGNNAELNVEGVAVLKVSGSVDAEFENINNNGELSIYVNDSTGDRNRLIGCHTNPSNGNYVTLSYSDNGGANWANKLQTRSYGISVAGNVVCNYPTSSSHAATKSYVDATITGSTPIITFVSPQTIQDNGDTNTAGTWMTHTLSTYGVPSTANRVLLDGYCRDTNNTGEIQARIASGSSAYTIVRATTGNFGNESDASGFNQGFYPINTTNNTIQIGVDNAPNGGYSIRVIGYW